ncbi:MAG TPA: GDSL-type esterase/lipase family protein [Chitinophagaceae bacterium]|nr:GDSL-type esterase/lipase family protein [Chitinophagaceae bacterium]
MKQANNKESRLLAPSLILNSILIIILIIAIIKYWTPITERFFSQSNKKKKIALLGNSLTAAGDWESLLSRKDVLNAGTGHGGFTTSHYVTLLQSDVIVHHPKICFIEGGINDISVGIPLFRTKFNLQSLIDTLKYYKITPVLTLTFHTSFDTLKNKMVDSINVIIKSLAEINKLEYIDINDKISENGFLKKEYTTDGTHFTKEAYPIWAKEISDVLAKLKI